ncbi:MAG: hypothetical protein KC589_01875 [Nanoarchaeota archaeon]|nr:hypothetical protein [Nanoarchaeota archaeon]
MQYNKFIIVVVVVLSSLNFIFGVQTNTSGGITLDMNFYFDSSTNDYDEFYNIDLSKYLADYSNFANEQAYYNFTLKRIKDMNLSIKYGSTMGSSLCNATTTNNGSFYCSFYLNESTRKQSSTSFAVCNKNEACGKYSKLITNNQSMQNSIGISLSSVVSFGETLIGTYVSPTENDSEHIYNQSWTYINVSSSHRIGVCNLNWNGAFEIMNKSLDNMSCYLNKSSVANGSYDYYVILNASSFGIESGNTSIRNIKFGYYVTLSNSNNGHIFPSFGGISLFLSLILLMISFIFT